MPEVSIIVPCYNASKFIVEALESVRSQDFTDWEIIVVDDSSEDDSSSLVGEISVADPRIRLFSVERGGVSAARNFGVQHARGKYLTFLDADDFLYKDALGSRYRLLEESNAIKAAVCKTVFVDPDGARLWDLIPPARTGFYEIALANHRFHISAVMIRSELLGSFQPFQASVDSAEDWLFFMRLARLGVVFHYTSSGGVAFRQHRHSTTHRQVLEQCTAQLDVLNIAFDRDPDVSHPHPSMHNGFGEYMLTARRARILLEWGIRALAIGDEEGARKLVSQIPCGTLEHLFTDEYLVGVIVFNVCKMKCVPVSKWLQIKPEFEEIFWKHRGEMSHAVSQRVIEHFKPARLKYESGFAKLMYRTVLFVARLAGVLKLPPSLLYWLYRVWHGTISYCTRPSDNPTRLEG